MLDFTPQVPGGARSDPALDEGAGQRWCAARLAPSRLPRRVTFVDTIPRDPSSKILERILREQFPGPAPD